MTILIPDIPGGRMLYPTKRTVTQQDITRHTRTNSDAPNLIKTGAWDFKMQTNPNSAIVGIFNFQLSLIDFLDQKISNRQLVDSFNIISNTF